MNTVKKKKKKEESGADLSTHPSSKLLFYSSMALLVLVVLGVYSNSISNGFVWDDKVQVVDNPWIKNIRDIGKIFSSDVFSYYQTVEKTNYYRPVAHVFYMTTWYAFGSNAWAFHLVNLLLHASVTILVFLVVLELQVRSLPTVAPGKQGKAWLAWSNPKDLFIALIASILFAVHPVHTEAVNWISGIMELAFTLFGLLSFHFFLASEEKRSDLTLGLSVFFFLLALFSKETAVVFLPLFFVYDLAFGNLHSISKTTYKKYASYLLAIVFYLSMRTYALGQFVPLDLHPELTNYECLINVFPLFVQHLEKLVWPINLNVFHVFHPTHSILDPRTLLGVAISIAYLSVTYWSWRRDRLLFFSLSLILIPLFPLFYVRGIAPVLFAEQHLYLPSVGFSLLLARITLWTTSQDRRLGHGFCFILFVAIGCFSILTFQRNSVWKDNLSLWSDAAIKSPDSAYVHESLGGGFLVHGQIDKAIAHYTKTLELNPTPSARVYNNIGVAYSQKGDPDEAMRAFSHAVRIRPDYARAHLGLGIALFNKGLTDKSISEIQLAIKYDQYLVDAYHNLGVAYLSQGKNAEAAKAMEQATALDPDYYKRMY